VVPASGRTIQNFRTAKENRARTAYGEKCSRFTWILDQIELSSGCCANGERINDQIGFDAIVDHKQTGKTTPHKTLLSNCRANPGKQGFWFSKHGKL